MGDDAKPVFGSRGADEKMAGLPETVSPAAERKNLLETLMAQQAKGQRDILSKDLLKEIEKKGPNEKEKIDLLASVLDKRQMENIHRAVETLKTNPEEIDDAKAEALHFMRETVPYLFSVLAIRFDLKETPSVQTFVDLLPKVTDPEEQELLDGVSFLTSHEGLETSRYFSTNLAPEIMADTKVLSQAARDALDAIKDKSVTTWMGEKMKEHPIATGAFLLLGSFGLYEAGKGLYHMVKGDKADEKAEQKENGPGLIGRLTEGWSFLTKTAISTAVFGGGLLIAGNILGNEQVEKYLKEHHLSFLYDYRLTAALIRFCQGDFKEGLATWNFGVRDPEARRRHEVYAEYFGVTDEAVWLMAGVNYKELMQADPKREFPLATGVFASLPVLKDYFKMPDQVSSENGVVTMIKAHEAQIHELIPDADTMSLDVLLKKAFELNIFEASKSAAAGTYSEDLQGFIGESEKESKAFSDKMKEVGAKTKLEIADLALLHESEQKVATELDGLRLTIPTYWTDTTEALGRVAPFLGVVDDAHVQDVDLVKAKQMYKAFADAASKSDLDAVGLDVAELKVIMDFTSKLDTTKPLSDADQALLAKYTDELARINDNVQQNIVRAKTARHKELLDDAAEWSLEKDGTEVAKLYFQGYKGLYYGLTWSLPRVLGENESLTERTVAVTGTVGLLTVGAGLPYGAWLIGVEKNYLSGAVRMLCPPIVLSDLRELYLTFFQKPQTLLELVLSGKMGFERAERICISILSHTDLIHEKWWTPGQDWAKSMKQFKMLKDLFSNRDNLEWLNDVLAKKIPFVRGPNTPVWQTELFSLIKEKTDLSFDEFIEKFASKRGEGILFESAPGFKEKMFAYFERNAKRFGDIVIPRPILEKLFGEGGAGLEVLKYFTKNAAHLGMTLGMAYLATYIVCKDTYEGKDKSEKIPLLVLGILVSEKVFTGVRAGEAFYGGARAGLTVLQTGEGAISGAELGEAVFAGFRAAELAPKHPVIMAIAALLAAIGVSIGAEALLAPYLKNPGIIASSVRGIGAPILYTLGAGQAVDTFGRYYNATNTTEKEYFMREIYLPKLGSKKMAFRDGDIWHPIDAYFNEMSPEDAVEVWNYQVREKMRTLKEEDEQARVSGKPVTHEQEIAELDSKIIDKDWISRQIAEVEGKKAEIGERGQTLYGEIMAAPFAASMSPVEKRLVESLLVTDVPETWFDESFYDIEKDSRFLLVRKFAHALDRDAELNTWVERKRLIYSDIEFYRTIKVDEKVMHPTEKDKLVATLGINPKMADQAEGLYQDIFGAAPAAEVAPENAAQAGA